MTDTQLLFIIQWTALYEMVTVLFVQLAIKINCAVFLLQNNFTKQVSKMTLVLLLKNEAETAAMQDSDYSIATEGICVGLLISVHSKVSVYFVWHPSFSEIYLIIKLRPF